MAAGNLQETQIYSSARNLETFFGKRLFVVATVVSRSSTDQKKRLLSLTMHVNVAPMVSPMKKNTSYRTKRTKEARRQNQRVDIEAVKVLRTVGDQEAFYFYEAVGKPTGEIARNLCDFLDKVKSVKSESLLFHTQRRDFENWIGKTLGDSKLALKLEEISSNNDDIRTILCKTIENRMKELGEPSAAILATENSPVLILPS